MVYCILTVYFGGFGKKSETDLSVQSHVRIGAFVPIRVLVEAHDKPLVKTARVRWQTGGINGYRES